MRNHLNARHLTALCIGVALSACGGGGGGGDASNPAPQSASTGAEKYLGSWQGCAVVVGGGSLRATYEFGKDGTRLTYSLRQESFSDSETCSGVAQGDSTESGNFATIGQTVTVDGLAMDQVALTVLDFRMSRGSLTSLPQGTYKQVLGISGSQELREGDLKSPRDAGGYPTRLGSAVFARQ